MRNHELFSVRTVPGEYKKLFGRDVDFFDCLELLPVVLRQTHAVPPEYIFIQDTVKNFKIITPCVYYSVRYVTTAGVNSCGATIDDMITDGQGILVNTQLKEWQDTMAVANGDVVVNQVPSKAIKVNQSFPKKPTGTYIDFKARGNVITLPYDNIKVNVLLTVIPLDEEGYPLITEQIITAMAYFLNLVWCQKKYYAGQLAKYIFDDAKNDSRFHIGEASTPQSMSDNEINDIMNALSTWNRHSVNTPFRY
jgi:hypothetical protein